jgi:cell division septal protein FtsQ
MARVALPQSKIKARRKKRRIRIASLAGGALVVLLLLLVWLSHAPFMLINAVEVTGNTTLSDSSIADAVLADVSGDYLFVFPKNNIFLYPKFKTEADLLQQMPTIAKVNVEAKNFNTLQVMVTERARKALWCGQTLDTSSSCFWLDQDGVAFSAVFDLSLDGNGTTTYQKYYGGLTGGEPQQYLTPDQFYSLSALIDALAQNQQSNSITGIAVDTQNDATVYFENGFKLLFSLSANGGDVYQRFVLALSSDAFANHQLSDFQYLDLRFGDKLYYKLK